MFDDIPRPGLWRRMLLGAVLVVFAAAGATAVAAFHEIDKVVDALQLGPELKLGRELAETDPGEPQTLMLLGSDRRPKNNVEGAAGARSDTIMLVRLDPKKEAIAIMSLPRDLKVPIPGYGTDKINMAYEYGGPRLTLRTVKRLTGLSVNHVINVNFKGFWRAVNAVGCVYADIDRRYYNGLAEYTYINLQPGYQRLCGTDALQYVRFRHEDNDLVRSARQQDFLRLAKQQVTSSELFENRDRLLRIFGRNTTTDNALRSRSEVLRLLKLVLGTAGLPIREVHFEGHIGPSYVEASDAQVKRLVNEFLQVEDTPGPRGELRAQRKPKRKRPRPRTPDQLGLEDASGFGKEQALLGVQSGAGGSLPVLYPRLRLKGSIYIDQPRVYKLRGTDGKRYGAYRMVLRSSNSALGEYYGVQGLTWQDPPILEDPAEVRQIGRREYELHYDGDRLRLVAWRTPKAVYWVSNTLLLTLTERQMLAIARSTQPL
ncbi:MAG TPA: LCP family protein [Thermoleophilaceae bacterium]|nr:LCP family protein [Thermoleophilaceae bacterium]